MSEVSLVVRPMVSLVVGITVSLVVGTIVSLMWGPAITRAGTISAIRAYRHRMEKLRNFPGKVAVCKPGIEFTAC